MKITSVKYKSDYIKVIFEDGSYLALPVKSEYMKLAQDSEIESELFSQMQADSDLYRCRKQLFKYLSISDKSAFECRIHLQKKKFPADVIKKVVDEFSGKNYINDSEFAKKYVSYLKRTKTVGKNYVLNKLYMKEIEKPIIESVMEDIKGFEENYDDILKLAEKKFKSIAGKKNNYAKLVYFLQARGFSSTTIFKVIDSMKNSGYKFYSEETAEN